MKPTIAIAFLLIAATVAFVPTASAMGEPCDIGEGSLVNQVQDIANCGVDTGQRVAYYVYCTIACP